MHVQPDVELQIQVDVVKNSSVVVCERAFGNYLLLFIHT